MRTVEYEMSDLINGQACRNEAATHVDGNNRFLLDTLKPWPPAGLSQDRQRIFGDCIVPGNALEGNIDCAAQDDACD